MRFEQAMAEVLRDLKGSKQSHDSDPDYRSFRLCVLLMQVDSGVSNSRKQASTNKTKIFGIMSVQIKVSGPRVGIAGFVCLSGEYTE